MEGTIGAHITIPETPETLRWAKNNLEFPNPEFEKKRRMGIYLGETPRILALYTREDGNLVIPYGCTKSLYRSFPGLYLNPSWGELTRLDYGGQIPLYDYQELAVSCGMLSGGGIITAKPGAGKTQIGLAIAQRAGYRCLWITHTQDLLNQSYERAVRYFPKDNLGKITEGKIHIGKTITFATVQTLVNLDFGRYGDHWGTVIVDECHRCAGTPTQISMFYKVMSHLDARHKFGLTGTPHRADGLIRTMFALIGDIAYSVPDEAVADRIMPVKVQTVPTGYVRHDDTSWDGTTIYAKMVTNLAMDPERNWVIRDLIKQLYDEGHSILILTSRLSQIDEIQKILPDTIRDASCKLNAKVSNDKRAKVLDAMRDGTKRILFASYSLAKEGLDVPCLDRLIMATPEKDYAVVTQALGRIARVCEGKTDAIAYDIVDERDWTLTKIFNRRKKIYKKNGMVIENAEGKL